MSGARTLAEALAVRADSAPGEPAIWLESLHADPETITCAALHERATDLARRLAGGGVEPGDRVVFLLPTGRDLVETLYGTLAAGAVTVPLYPPAGARQLEGSLENVRRVVRLTRPAKLITLDPLADLLRREPGIGDAVRKALVAMGHEISTDATTAFGGAQAIMRLPKGWAAASDPRKDGQAVAY